MLSSLMVLERKLKILHTVVFGKMIRDPYELTAQMNMKTTLKMITM